MKDIVHLRRLASDTILKQDAATWYHLILFVRLDSHIVRMESGLFQMDVAIKQHQKMTLLDSLLEDGFAM